MPALLLCFWHLQKKSDIKNNSLTGWSYWHNLLKAKIAIESADKKKICFGICWQETSCCTTACIRKARLLVMEKSWNIVCLMNRWYMQHTCHRSLLPIPFTLMSRIGAIWRACDSLRIAGPSWRDPIRMQQNDISTSAAAIRLRGPFKLSA